MEGVEHTTLLPCTLAPSGERGAGLCGLSAAVVVELFGCESCPVAFGDGTVVRAAFPGVMELVEGAAWG